MHFVKRLADIHCHPSMKPSRNPAAASIWDITPESDKCQNWLVQLVTKSTDSFSQTNLDKCKDASMRLVALSLYPPERQMFDLRPLAEWLLPDWREIDMGTCLSGFERSLVEEYIQGIRQNRPVNYFAELEQEYDYLLGQQAESVPGKRFVIVRDFEHYQKALAEDPEGTVCGFMSVEGMHAFGEFDSFEGMNCISFDEVDDRQSAAFKHYRAIFEKNIAKAKSWGGGAHAPLFVTYSHHFWNLLAGHAKSLGGLMGQFGLDQENGLNKGFTALGEDVLEMLWSRDNGRRVLVDIKHMSVNARMDFYRIWERYRSKGDNVPIVCSHSAVAGINRLKNKKNRLDTDRELEGRYFNTWSINLMDEDIRYIHASDGLIGLLLHEGRMPGGIPKDRIELFKKAHDDGKDPHKDLLRDEYVKLFMANIFYCVDVIGEKSAWDMICLGTDFDGLVNGFDIYNDVRDLQTLATHMYQFFLRPLENKKIGFTKEKMERLMFGYDARELVEKICYGNVERFLEKYFNEKYLREAQTVEPALPPQVA